MGLITLWTIQTPMAWSLLNRNGVLSGDGRRIDRYFRTPYHWLMGEMKERIPGYGGKFPLWFWTEKPDLRTGGLEKSGTQAVCIECVIPKERVLLSDYGNWHTILNDSYFAHSEQEFDAWYARIEAGAITAEEAEKEKRESWKRVFDLQTLAALPEWHGSLRIQATIEKLYLSEIKGVRFFKAR